MARSAKVGSVPPEALSGGSLNESTPEDQRTATREEKLAKGPNKGENNQHLPASYKLRNGNVRTDR